MLGTSGAARRICEKFHKRRDIGLSPANEGLRPSLIWLRLLRWRKVFGARAWKRHAPRLVLFLACLNNSAKFPP
jgi:hypothetical protein